MSFYGITKPGRTHIMLTPTIYHILNTQIRPSLLQTSSSLKQQRLKKEPSTGSTIAERPKKLFLGRKGQAVSFAPKGDSFTVPMEGLHLLWPQRLLADLNRVSEHCKEVTKSMAKKDWMMSFCMLVADYYYLEDLGSCPTSLSILKKKNMLSLTKSWLFMFVPLQNNYYCGTVNCNPAVNCN